MHTRSLCFGARLVSYQYSTVTYSTGWGYYGQKEYIFTFPDKISLENASTIDDDAPFLKMPKEILAHVFEYLDPTEGCGRLAMALTCKTLAMIGRLSKVLKTAMNTGHDKLGLVPANKKLCSGCAKVRPLRRGYWDKVSRLLRRQWNELPASETQDWKTLYTDEIRNWRQGLANVFPWFLAPLSCCPSCVCQHQWEAWQASELTDSSPSLQDKVMKMRITEIILRKRRNKVVWGKSRQSSSDDLKG